MKQSIFFQTTKTGKKRAYRYSWMQFRAFPMAMAEAELLLATGQAELLPGHPFPVAKIKAAADTAAIAAVAA